MAFVGPSILELTTLSILIATVISVVALVVAAHAAFATRRSAIAAERSADAAEQAAVASREAVAVMREQMQNELEQLWRSRLLDALKSKKELGVWRQVARFVGHLPGAARARAWPLVQDALSLTDQQAELFRGLKRLESPEVPLIPIDLEALQILRSSGLAVPLEWPADKQVLDGAKYWMESVLSWKAPSGEGSPE